MARRTAMLHPLEPADVGPRAGKLGIAAIVVYGIAVLLAAFVAAYFWSDGDGLLAGMIAIATMLIPVGIGFAVAETASQRTGAIAFVIVAALLAGAVGAWAYAERDDYEERQDQKLPDIDDLRREADRTPQP